MISIIDDDTMMRHATGDLLQSFGYEASTFASAEEFLGSDGVNSTSCVITDVRMPGISGVELQRILIARGNRTPIIFMTASAEEGVRRRALEAGAVGYLAKPFDAERLIGYLENALQKSSRSDTFHESV
jgi:FixJ family two-component response regulator